MRVSSQDIGFSGSGSVRALPASRCIRSGSDRSQYVFHDFIAQDTFRRVQQLSRPLAISASCLKRILNEVALVGHDCAIERKPRDGARLFGSLERWRKVM